jgi:hypothetical protein
MTERLASFLMNRAASMLPTSRREWASAMHNEFAYVPSNEALRWASGCFFASLGERLRAFRFPDHMPLRVGASFVMLFLAFGDLFPALLTMSYRMGALDLAESLGKNTPGDDYRRLIPLMEAIPLWLLALSALAAVLYLIAIIGALIGKRAYRLVLLALAFEITAEIVGRPIIAATGVTVNPNPSLVAIVLPWILPLSTALLLWKLHPRERA